MAGSLLAVVFADAIRTIGARVVGAVLTNWLGYAGAVAVLLAVPSWQFSINPWLLATLVLALPLGLVWSKSTATDIRKGRTVRGIFILEQRS